MKKFPTRNVVAVSLIVVVLSTLLATFWVSTHRAVPSVQTEFVTRSGSRLLLHGQPFRFAGPNIYWLGLDGNLGSVAYPTHFRVDDALVTAQAMGATVVRAHTLGISVGCSLCVEPSRGVFNAEAMQHIDYAIKSAHDHNIRLIIPFTDNWRYYHGGIHIFTEWRGLTATYTFFSDPAVIGDFKAYIAQLLNHVNGYTGIAYKNDPTIMAWETGNEITPTTKWTKTITEFIKGVDPKHLVMDGTKGVDVGVLALNSVDIFSDHYYPISMGLLDADATIARNRQKVFIVGEYDWTGTQGGDSLASFTMAVERSDVAGDLYWALFAHNDSHGFVADDSGYSLHFPGDTDDRRSRVQTLRAHAYRIRGAATPAYAAPGAPVITSVAHNKVAWRGTTIAVNYTVERSTLGMQGPWTVLCDRCATDAMTPWTDSSKPAGTVWYRVQAYNMTGTAGPYSPVFST